jgi:hypothetical protein
LGSLKPFSFNEQAQPAKRVSCFLSFNLLSLNYATVSTWYKAVKISAWIPLLFISKVLDIP